MHKLEKYFKKLVSFIDISPIESGGITKLPVYALWGINALLFLSYDIDFSPEYIGSSSSTQTSIQCTVLKKISTTDLYVEYFTFIKVYNFVVILPCGYELPNIDVIALPRDRSPPTMLFS